MEDKLVSVVIPVRNEEKYIQRCINSIVKQDFDKNKLEVIFIDGQSEDNTRDIIKENMKKYTMFKLLKNDKRITPCALNIGIKNAKGKYIVRMDAHSEYPKNYISKCIYYIQNKDADNVGCLIETKAEGNKIVGKAIVYILSSKFGVGNSSFRTNATSGNVDTVPFGTFKKELFEKIGYFDERLERSEDNEFNSRIIKNNGKIYLFNDIKITYYARDSIGKLIKMAFLNGKWNILANYYVHNSMRLRHFIPLMFVLSIIIGGVACIFNIMYIKYAFMFEILLYLILDLYFSLKSIRDGTLQAILCFVIYPIFHVVYGIGSLVGIFHIFKMKLIK